MSYLTYSQTLLPSNFTLQPTRTTATSPRYRRQLRFGSRSRASGKRSDGTSAASGPREQSCLIVSDGLDDLLAGVHHERTVCDDRLADRIGMAEEEQGGCPG